MLIEYVMLAGINDSQEVAHQLGALMKDHKVVISEFLSMSFLTVLLEIFVVLNVSDCFKVVCASLHLRA